MNPQSPIPVTLTAAQWNLIMYHVGKQPYEAVADLIHSIQAQCVQHEVTKVAEHVSDEDKR